MTPDQVLEYYGTQSAIADKLGITRQSVNDWFTTGVVPNQRQWQIELATKGVLKADTSPAQQ